MKVTDLFERHGSEELAFSARCEQHAGQDVEICGWLYQAGDGAGPVMLVSRPGDCPDKSGAPVAAIILPGFRRPKHAFGPVTLRGRLSYGLDIRGGIASYLRLERARVATIYSP